MYNVANTHAANMQIHARGARCTMIATQEKRSNIINQKCAQVPYFVCICAIWDDTNFVSNLHQVTCSNKR